MSIRGLLLGLERRYAWGLIGFVVGTVIGLAGLYVSLRELRPKLIYEILTDSNVLDVRARQCRPCGGKVKGRRHHPAQLAYNCARWAAGAGG